MIEFLRRVLYGYPVLERVVVNLKGGRVIRGVMWAQGRRYVRLRAAEVLREQSGQVQPIQADGEVLVPTGNVEFMQVV